MFNKLPHNVKILSIALVGIFASVFFCIPHKNPFQLAANPSPVFVFDTMPNSKDKIESLLIKKDTITSNLSQFKAISHESKGVFRLTVPILMKILGIKNLLQLYLLQLLAGVALYVFFAAVIYQTTNSYTTSLVSTLAIAGTYFGKAYFLDTYPWLDTFAFMLTILCIWGRNKPYLLLPSLIALCYVDERGFFCAVMLMLIITLLRLPKSEDIRLKDLFSFSPAAIYISLGIILAIAIRVLLGKIYGMHLPNDPSTGYTNFIAQWKRIPEALFAGLVGMWGIILMSIGHAAYRKKFLFSLILSGVVLVFITVSVSIHDMTRSIAYLMPISIISIKYMRDNIQGYNFTIATIAVVNLIYPTTFVIKNKVFDWLGAPAYYHILVKLSSIVHTVL